MDKKKRSIALLICGFFISMIAFFSAAPPPPPPQNDFEQNPPVATAFWVQQLPQPIQGNNMLIAVKYTELEPMPLQLAVYVGSNTITLYDDGTHGDSVANDSIYTTYLKDDPVSFQNSISSRIQGMAQQSTVLSFTGHLGTVISSQQSFDFQSFNSFLKVSLPPTLLGAPAASAGAGCMTSILKQNSLFITDTSVVENLSRTYIVDSFKGNKVGLWTFGNLMTNIAGIGTGISTKALMHSWLQNYASVTVVNGQPINDRQNLFSLLIGPWLFRAHAAPSVAFVTRANWDSLWNAANQDSLVDNAPFKLTAIVNRLDLRGNSGYSGTISNSGETRFIFTLIDPNQGDGPLPFGNGGLTTGMPPMQDSNEHPPLNLYDWKGMNVIFEYGNPQTNLCDVVALANRWYQLSTMTLGSTAYLDSLDAITRTVITAGAGGSKPNGSAINRIRTNERILDTGSANLIPPWIISDWEFRQFELQSSGASMGLFAQVPLTNTPMNAANGINSGPISVNYSPTIPLSTVNQDSLMDWIFSNPAIATQIFNGNQSIPAVFLGHPVLSGGSRSDMEYLHYFDLNWYDSTHAPVYHANIASVHANPAFYKQVRQQLSLNTCNGCHTQETQTIFTHVAPIGYRQTANYWAATPDVTSGNIDERFSSPAAAGTGVYRVPPTPEDIVRVSAFLTGRNLRRSGSGTTFQDDSVSTAEDATDPTMTGLFYVNAPDNYTGNFLHIPNKKFGYNDLQRRAQDLCALANTNCSLLTTMALFDALIAIPLPLAGH